MSDIHPELVGVSEDHIRALKWIEQLKRRISADRKNQWKPDSSPNSVSEIDDEDSSFDSRHSVEEIKSPNDDIPSLSVQMSSKSTTELHELKEPDSPSAIMSRNAAISEPSAEVSTVSSPRSSSPSSASPPLSAARSSDDSPPLISSPNRVRSSLDQRQRRSSAVDSSQLQSDVTGLIRTTRRPPTRLDIMRVNQADAEQLDKELGFMLKLQFTQIFKFFEGTFLDRFSPEIQACLDFMIYRFSIYTDKPSAGSLLQNLRYRDEWNSSDSIGKYEIPYARRVLHGLLSIGGRWLWTRIIRHTTNEGYGGYPQGSRQLRVYKFMRLIENLYQFSSILNFLSFLYAGKYRSLIDRLLGMRLVYNHHLVSRQVSFEFMNQQLVWSSMSEFLLFIMPLINFQKLRAWLRQFFRVSATSAAANTDGVLGACPLCGCDPISTPFVTNCAHVFCYYCISASRLVDQSQYRCPVCSEVITSHKRYVTGVDSGRRELLPSSSPDDRRDDHRDWGDGHRLNDGSDDRDDVDDESLHRGDDPGPDDNPDSGRGVGLR
uniref:Peroxisome biogenesis factor 2 n=1 Tax=Hirondellea gigas TaxID=1518452 RepID=A0A6A7G7X7_9CRUS